MSEIKYCPKCGTKIVPNTRFCAECGSSIPLTSGGATLSSANRLIWSGIAVVALLFGLLFLSMGAGSIVAPEEVWRTRTATLYSDETVRQPGWQKDLWIRPYVTTSPALSLGETRDFLITGNIQEVKERGFNFYIFDPENYEYWKAKMPYKAYIEKKGGSKYVFEFMPTKQDYDKLRFVVENLTPDVGSPDLVFKLSATLTWKQMSASTQFTRVAVGFFFSGIGLVLLIGASVILYYRVRTRVRE